MKQWFLVFLCLLLTLGILSGCAIELERERAVLEAYFLPLLELSENPAQYQLECTNEDLWYLYQWYEPDDDSVNPYVPSGMAYPLSHTPDTVVHQPCDDFSITVAVESTDPTTLSYSITNHSEQELSLREIRWLDVELDAQWYRLWFQGVSWQTQIKEKIAPGAVFTDTVPVRLRKTPLTLPAGHYRWCFLLKIGEEEIPSAVEFDIPETE